ncbi:hypothetical protein C1N51_12070 [Vibrio campbellii]|nr:hypothetical protein C1N51_12070 [Vibrio campbellii]
MSFKNPIPVRLKYARKKANLSQKALGVRIGMDESTASARMNQYERGRHTPELKTLKLIADELRAYPKRDLFQTMRPQAKCNMAS